MTTRRGEPIEEEPMSARSGRMDGQQEREAGLSADEVARSSIEEWKHTFTHAVLAASAEGIEKAIMDYKESVEDILRPLVEAKVACPCSHDDPEATGLLAYRQQPYGDCGERLDRTAGLRPDPRFDALRRWEYYPPPLPSGWTIDASLGAIIEAAHAFGLTWILFTPGACAMSRSENELGWRRAGATPTEAAARALVAAHGEMT